MANCFFAVLLPTFVAVGGAIPRFLDVVVGDYADGGFRFRKVRWCGGVMGVEGQES